MKTLVDFMYLGEVLINQNNVERFFKLAKTFNIQGFQNGFNKNEVSFNSKYYNHTLLDLNLLFFL